MKAKKWEKETEKKNQKHFCRCRIFETQRTESPLIFVMFSISVDLSRSTHPSPSAQCFLLYDLIFFTPCRCVLVKSFDCFFFVSLCLISSTWCLSRAYNCCCVFFGCVYKLLWESALFYFKITVRIIIMAIFLY